eukprot:CAMPEP_0185263580 /NCGR_PEP_ID=MMETSP1359-20130426/15315_1 /TAXON_ID=552665 /ORGANISM="Bigelowiella longifila, Strain CCMP242" /LENGTH=48 /DNA_ID= /DNA_START= /DNA_END= /DNA_ORIENTATION=
MHDTYELGVARVDAQHLTIGTYTTFEDSSRVGGNASNVLPGSCSMSKT